MIKPVNVVMMVTPVAKARARVTFTGGRVMAYTPAKTRNAETEIRLTIRQYLLHELNLNDGEPYFPAGLPLRLEAMFVIPRPKTAPKKRLLPVARPDCSNYVKTLEDSLNKFLWADDSQLTTVLIKKRYGLMPAIHLSVQEDTDINGNHG